MATRESSTKFLHYLQIKDPIVRENFQKIQEFLDNNLFTVPVGSVLGYVGTTAPKGFLLADGSVVSRTRYERLFNIVGTTFGSGDGSSTFDLPDKTDLDVASSTANYIIKT